MSQVRKDVLNGWKEIAAYLGRDPRTVERWEKTRFLPVRRLPGSGRSTVYALVSELDAWLASPVRETEPPGLVEAVAPLSEPAIPSDPEIAGLRGRRATDGVRSPTVTSPSVNRGARLRWIVAAALAGVLLCGGLAAVVWHREHRLSAAARAIPVHTLVPPSAVTGVEELYLRGCYQTELRTPESLAHAQDAFSEALKRDPHYAPALAGLASTYILLREYSVLPDAQAYPLAKDAASRAITLDPTSSQAHAVLGFVDFFWIWDAAGAEKQFQNALQLEPGLPLAHHWYGSMLTHEGRFQDGLRELNVAQRLQPSSAAILTSRAFALGLSGRRDESFEMLNEAISSETSGAYRNPATMHHVMATLSLLQPRDVPRYLSEELLAADLRRDTQAVQSFRFASSVYAAKGEHAMWQALLSREQKRPAPGGPTYATARYEAELGEKDEALKDLDALLVRHDSALIGIAVDPLFAPVRQDGHFQKIELAMGLPKAVP